MHVLMKSTKQGVNEKEGILKRRMKRLLKKKRNQKKEKDKQENKL